MAGTSRQLSSVMEQNNNFELIDEEEVFKPLSKIIIHKKNLGRKYNYHNVLFDHRKEYADYDFDWNNVEILHSESNKGKKVFKATPPQTTTILD